MTSIKDKIKKVLNNGQVLLIVPPFYITDYCMLGLHTLQSIARRAGYKTDILYSNLLLASVIGSENYKQIYNSPPYWLLQERLFARSAHNLPALGTHPEYCDNEALSVKGDIGNYVNSYFDVESFDIDGYLHIEKQCYAFVHEVADCIARLDYKIIGFSAIVGYTNACVALLNKIKERNEDIITLLGGGNCHGKMANGMISLSQHIDYVFSGTSENSFYTFLCNYRENNLPDNEIIIGNDELDINNLDLPDYSDYNIQIKEFMQTPAKDVELLYQSSRGCEWGCKNRCNFCGFEGIKTQQKEAEKVKDELLLLKKLYPNRGVYCIDDMFPRNFYKDLLPEITGKDIHSMTYMVRPPLTLEKIISLKKANINFLLPGIESLSSDVLKLLNKGTRAIDCINLLRFGKSLNIWMYWYLMWGIPGDKIESYEKILRLIPLIRHFNPPYEFVHLKLYKSSNYIDNPKKFYIKNIKPLNVFHSIYPETAQIEDAAYYLYGDYDCESHDFFTVIEQINHEINIWKKSADDFYLHMIQAPFSNNEFIVVDKREVNQKEKTFIVSMERAKNIMSPKKYIEKHEHIEWAIENKLGVYYENWYIPLITADYRLLSKLTIN